MKKIFYTVIIMLCITVFLAGCSGSAESSDSKAIENTAEKNTQSGESEPDGNKIETSVNETLIEPEQLISKQEAEELLGELVCEGEKSQMESVGQKIIFYDSEAEGSFGFLQVSLTQPSAMPKESTITPEETYGAAKAGLDETSGVSVSGIGDDCFTGTPGLHILCKGCYIVIGAGNSDDPAVQEIWKTAGALVVANLEELL